jgi:hypothetical protein
VTGRHAASGWENLTKPIMQFIIESLTKAAEQLRADAAQLEKAAEILRRAQEPTKPEPDWHNPCGLASAGEGYRFCLKSETEDDATHYWSARKMEWEYETHEEPGAPLAGITYRTSKPLP